MANLQVQLVDADAVKPKKWSIKQILLAQLAVVLIATVVGVSLGKALWPKMPENLTPAEASRILQMQKGHAGYSLVKSDTDGSSLGHAMFCPTCGNEVATVYVNFLPPAPPQVGSRLALMTDLAQAALANAAPSKQRAPTQPTPVVASAQ